MHRLLTIALCLILTLNLSAEEKRAMMWFDATANFERFSHRDSISHYLQKISAIGFTDVVVDIRPITGEVLYDSRHAPRMREWKGYVRPDFDYLAYFITTAHALGRCMLFDICHLIACPALWHLLEEGMHNAGMQK